MKKSGSEKLASFPDAANTFVQETEMRLLNELRKHVEALEIQLAKAKLQAHGRGERNQADFIKGCGCRSCITRVGGIQRKLDRARKKYYTELERLSPYQNMEPNPEGVMMLTAGV